jgi:hypothetical protein
MTEEKKEEDIKEIKEEEDEDKYYNYHCEDEQELE